MPAPRLRVYSGPQPKPAEPAKSVAEEDRIRIALGDIYPVLADAIRHDRTWLQDFVDDEITISSDLYELILAYQNLKRPSA